MKISPSLKVYSLWHIAIAGFCVILVGLGLCRFAYTPLIPAMINAGWLTKSGAGYLGSINFAGYLVGAYLGMRAARYVSLPKLINGSLVISIISLGLCAFNFGFLWFAIWRFVAGVTGALLMVTTPGTILKKVPVTYRGRISGVLFAGLGLGTIITGFFFPYLATIQVAFGWLGAAIVALVVSFFAWPVFFQFAQEEKTSPPTTQVSTQAVEHKKTLFILAIAYSCYGVGIVPHSLFLVDYVHRQLGLSVIVSGLFWSFFGGGCISGPLWRRLYCR